MAKKPSLTKKKQTNQKAEIALEVKNVSKSFRLPTEQASGIKQAFVNWTRGIKGYKEQKVLKDISFKVEKGDFFGIVGRNGSGKSTLLKLISQIYTPDKGQIKVNGKLVPFIELGVGFNPELTGRENVYLNGALLGFSHEEVSAMYEEIVEFAELEEFMDQKLKNYSSGMQVRLAFSIAIKADADVLVLDEVLAVGDEAFQRKCFQYFAELKRNKKTVILVTHSMNYVQQFCNKAIMIEKGKIIESGNPTKVAQCYREIFAPVIKKDKSEGDGENTYQPIEITAKATRKNGKVKATIKLVAREDIKESILSVFIDRDTGEQVYRFSSDEKTGEVLNLKKGETFILDLELQDIFPDGVFEFRASIKSYDRTQEYASRSRMASFEVVRSIESGSEWDVHWQPNEEFKVRYEK